MQYPRMGNVRPYRISIPQLNGGVNLSVPPHLIQDNQLSEVENMWYREGRLHTRPALKNAFGTAGECQTQILIRTMKARDKICGIFYSFYEGEHGYVFRFWTVEDGRLTNAVAKKVLWDRDPNDLQNILAIENCVTVKDVAGEEHEDISIIFYTTSIDSAGNNICKVFGISSDPDKSLAELPPYIPTIIKGGVPTETSDPNLENGSLFEPYNLLSNQYKCRYTSDGKGLYYRLPKNSQRWIEDVTDVKIFYTDKDRKQWEFSQVDEEYNTAANNPIFKATEEGSGYDVCVNLYDGYFSFVNAGGGTDEVLPLTGTANNVEIVITEKEYLDHSHLTGASISTWFGGGSSGLSGGTRLFVAGSKAEPNVMRWSSLNNPLYFPENNYAYVGADNEKITAFGKQSDMLVIFKEKELYFSYYMQGSVSGEAVENQEIIDVEAARALFPVYQLHPNIGCDLPNTICLCNNRLVWFNRDRKAYGLFTAGLYSERNVRRLSDVIDEKLQEISDEDIQSAIAYELDDHYLVQFNRKVFVMDYSSNGFSYYSSYSSDEKAQKAIQWYYWDLFKDENLVLNFVSTTTYDGKHFLFAMYEEGETDRYTSFIYDPTAKRDHFHGNEYDIHSMFATKLFDFGFPERYKRINPFYLQVSGEDGKTLNLTYLNENGTYTDACSPTFNGEPLEKTDPRRISPNAVRVREFGIKMECDGYMEVGSLVLNYAMMGTVR